MGPKDGTRETFPPVMLQINQSKINKAAHDRELRHQKLPGSHFKGLKNDN